MSWTDHVKALGEGSVQRGQFLDDRHKLQRRRQTDPHRRPLQRQRAGLPCKVRRGGGKGI